MNRNAPKHGKFEKEHLNNYNYEKEKSEKDSSEKENLAVNKSNIAVNKSDIAVNMSDIAVNTVQIANRWGVRAILVYTWLWSVAKYIIT